MRSDSLLFWVVVAVALGTVVALMWLGHWLLALPLGVAALAYLVNPRLEAYAEGEGSSGAPRRAWSALRTELIFIGGCLLLVPIAAYR